MSGEASSSKTKIFPLFGYPIAQSSAPAFHNAVFKADRQVAEYVLRPTSEVTAEMLEMIRSEECGGAAVTMPLKTLIIPHLDRITPESEATGAVNTIVKLPHEGRVELVGTNTDYIGSSSRSVWLTIGIIKVLLSAISSQPPAFRSGLSEGRYAGAVIGGGATTRSAIYALYNLGIRVVYIVNRDPAEVEVTICWFRDRSSTSGLELRVLRDASHAEQELGGESARPVGLIVGAIPGTYLPLFSLTTATPPSTPAERNVYSTAMQLFTIASSSSRFIPSSSPDAFTPIMLEMAYIPQRTPLLVIAETLGIQVVGGIYVMIEQGLAQQRIWKSGSLDAPDVLSKEAEDTGRRLIWGNSE